MKQLPHVKHTCNAGHVISGVAEKQKEHLRDPEQETLKIKQCFINNSTVPSSWPSVKRNVYILPKAPER